jgi:hypothetical protein
MPPLITSTDRVVLGMLKRAGNEVAPRFWQAFPPDQAERLRQAWESTLASGGIVDEAALALEQVAEVRPDLTHVHPTWLVRGLKDEAPSVQRAVVAHLPPALGRFVQAGLGLADADLQRDGKPHHEALRWVLSLWTERLVGDQPDRQDDPAVIVALTRLGPRGCYRLARAAGQVKWALAAEPPHAAWRKGTQERLADLERLDQSSDSRIREWARRDVAALDRSSPQLLARLGLVTFARLLEPAEPYRVRWALQHIPYPIAKRLRGLMASKSRRAPQQVDRETETLRVAWIRLYARGQLTRGWGGVS